MRERIDNYSQVALHLPPDASEVVGEVLELPQEMVHSAGVYIKSLIRTLGVFFFILVYSFFVGSALYYMSDDEETSTIFPGTPISLADHIIPINMKAYKMSPGGVSVAFQVAIDYPNLPSSYKIFPNRINQGFRLLISGNEFDFLNDTIPESQIVVLKTTGSNVYYPFDTYEVQFDIQVSDQLEPLDFYANNLLDLKVKMDYGMNGLVCNFNELRATPGATFDQIGSKIIHGTINRTPTFLIFPLFILLSFIGYGVSIGMVGYLVAFRPNSAVDNYRFMPAFAALQFAVPKIRSDLPFAPPIGSIIDYFIYYWVHCAVVSAFIIIISRQAYIFSQNCIKMDADKLEKERQQAKTEWIEERKKKMSETKTEDNTNKNDDNNGIIYNGNKDLIIKEDFVKKEMEEEKE